MPASGSFTVSGGHSEGDTPLPIPNRVVKPLSADGTWCASAWESRSPPDFPSRPPLGGLVGLTAPAAPGLLAFFVDQAAGRPVVLVVAAAGALEAGHVLQGHQDAPVELHA